jgi:hypothetical protein
VDDWSLCSICIETTTACLHVAHQSYDGTSDGYPTPDLRPCCRSRARPRQQAEDALNFEMSREKWSQRVDEARRRSEEFAENARVQGAPVLPDNEQGIEAAERAINSPTLRPGDLVATEKVSPSSSVVVRQTNPVISFRLQDQNPRHVRLQSFLACGLSQFRQWRPKITVKVVFNKKMQYV